MIKLGINISFEEFWNMDPNLIYMYIKAKSEQVLDDAKARAVTNYNLATMAALFVGLTLNGKHIPEIHEVYPNLFDNEEYRKQQMEAYKHLFEAFAIQHNNKRALKGLTNDT